MVDYAHVAVFTPLGVMICKTDRAEGYIPQPQFGKFVSLQVAQNKADALNAELGLSKEDSRRIVISAVPDEGSIDSGVEG